MKPSDVRVTLGENARLVFRPTTQDGINYSALVTPLKEVVGTVCKFTIEVLFGEKIFVPINRMITVGDVEPTIVCPPAEVVAPPEYVAPPIETVIHTLPPEEEVQPEGPGPIETLIKSILLPPEEEIIRPPEVQPEFAVEIPSHIEEPENHVDLEKKETPPFTVTHVHEEKAPGIIPSIDFTVPPKAPNLFSEITGATKIVVTEQKKPVVKVKRAPLPKLTNKKPTGVDVNALTVTKAIFSEEIKEEPVKQCVKKPVVQEERIPSFPIIIKREEIVYL
jgi:hypothetical protein